MIFLRNDANFGKSWRQVIFSSMMSLGFYSSEAVFSVVGKDN